MEVWRGPGRRAGAGVRRPAGARACGEGGARAGSHGQSLAWRRFVRGPPEVRPAAGPGQQVWREHVVLAPDTCLGAICVRVVAEAARLPRAAMRPAGHPLLPRAAFAVRVGVCSPVVAAAPAVAHARRRRWAPLGGGPPRAERRSAPGGLAPARSLRV